MSRSSFNPFISLWGLSAALFRDPSNSVLLSKCEMSFSWRLLLFSATSSSPPPQFLFAEFPSPILNHSPCFYLFLFQTLRPQRMRPQNLRWKPKRGPGGTKTRLVGEDLQVFHLKSNLHIVSALLRLAFCNQHFSFFPLCL